MKRFKSVVSDVFRSLGYHVGIAPPTVDSLSGYLEVLFERYDIDCVIDVGANEGQYAQRLKDFGYEGRICSFEPVSRPFEQLADRAKGDDEWLTFRKALGARMEIRELDVAKSSQMSSFQEATAGGRSVFGEKLEIDHTEEVEVFPLDGLIESCLEGLESPEIHLKVDTQGFERAVFEGAEETLPWCRSIQAEAAVQPMYEGALCLQDAIDVYREMEFEIGGIFPVRYGRDATLLEVDLVGVRDR